MPKVMVSLRSIFYYKAEIACQINPKSKIQIPKSFEGIHEKGIQQTIRGPV